MEDETVILLKKYFKLYTEGKNNFNKNVDKSIEYFKESLDVLNVLKNKHSSKIKKHKDLLEETENECYKYLTLSIESSINNHDIEKNKKIDLNDLVKSLECGNLDMIKNLKFGQIDFKELINGQTILHHAIKLGDTSFLKHAFKIGARIDTTNAEGNTLLEYACLEQDPNMINVLSLHGANMQKHLYFREGNVKLFNNNNQIDCCILIKIILSYIPKGKENKNINNKIYNKIKLIQNIINIKEKININDYIYADLLIGLMFLLNKIPEDNALTYLNIIIEELSYIINNKLGCPPNKLEIILINLVPFIEYPFTISTDWVISSELKYLILNLIKKKKNYNNLDIREELIEYLWEIYIKKGIIQEDYLGCLISQWITKIKV
jgi:hypothetical protein